MAAIDVHIFVSDRVVGPLLIALNPTWVQTIPPVPGNPVLTVFGRWNDEHENARRGSVFRYHAMG